jgi:predicted Zn-dependent peptidase
MQRLLIEPGWIESEKGAVLAEMHGYENDPASVLHDALVYTSFQGHPYRNNVIGWETDISALQHADVVKFYRQHYQPANAVLAVVGDVDLASVRERVLELFGDFLPSEPTPLPHTLDPPQHGERRVELIGAGESSHFEIAWRAPAANHPDFAAMLVFQEWLSGGSGINFMQEFGTTAAKPGSALFGQVEGLQSWYPPAAQEYLFSISGTMAADGDSEEPEQLIEDTIRAMREGEVSEQLIARSRERVLEELVYDLGTHEETAHQLAFYNGLNALDEWLALPEKVRAVTPEQVVLLAQTWFQPWQRNTAWFRAGEKPVPGVNRVNEASARKSKGGSIEQQPVLVDRAVQKANISLPAPKTVMLDNGLPLLLQENPASRAAYIKLVIAGTQWSGSSYLETNTPAWGSSSLGTATLPENLEATVKTLLAELGRLQVTLPSATSSADPGTRLEDMQKQILGLARPATGGPAGQQAGLVAVVISGSFNTESLATIESLLAGQARPRQEAAVTGVFQEKDLRVSWPRELAQAQLAYVVPAPAPRDPDSLSWRALQYLLAHDYEGRLGKEAISIRGLAYYIDSRYESDGRQAWISLGTGVDPGKQQALEQLFREKIAQLVTHPPTETELVEARSHLAGRLLTRNQANAELAYELGRQWLWYGRLLGREEQLAAIEHLDQQALAKAARGFDAGAFAIIEAGKSPENVTD